LFKEVAESRRAPTLMAEPALRREQLIERIMRLNMYASPDFLASFSEARLEEYLEHLTAAQEPRGSGRGWVRPATTPAIVWREPPHE
jgi:hypothetical protein